MRGGGSFSADELQMLRKLPAVANATKDRITYADTFKRVCVIRYLAGESPTKIFREAGLPPELIGYKRIERSVARWKKKRHQIRERQRGDGQQRDHRAAHRTIRRHYEDEEEA